MLIMQLPLYQSYNKTCRIQPSAWYESLFCILAVLMINLQKKQNSIGMDQHPENFALS